MKKLATAIAAIALLGTPAFAADMAVKAPPPAPPPPSSWTGFYFGGDLGGAWMSGPNLSFADPNNAGAATCMPCFAPFTSPTLSANHDSSIFGGFFGGYNWQFSPQWVAGIEGDISWTNLSASASGPLSSIGFPGPPTGVPFVVPGSNLSFHTDVQWIATARGRLGWLWTPNLLIYGTGGAAWGRFANYANATFPCFCFTTSAPFSNVKTETGWVAGGGVEWQMFEHVRVRAEYLYYRFDETTNGSGQFPFCIGVFNCPALYTFGNQNIQTVRGGISYAF